MFETAIWVKLTHLINSCLKTRKKTNIEIKDIFTYTAPSKRSFRHRIHSLLRRSDARGSIDIIFRFWRISLIQQLAVPYKPWYRPMHRLTSGLKVRCEACDVISINRFVCNKRFNSTSTQVTQHTQYTTTTFKPTHETASVPSENVQIITRVTLTSATTWLAYTYI